MTAQRDPIGGYFEAPASKPETQRALLMAALAEGTSSIERPLVARETQVMIAACRALGARIAGSNGQVTVEGIGRELRSPARAGTTRYIWAAGSALVGRLFATIGSAIHDRVVVDGNCNLRSRPFAPLFTALAGKGVAFEFLDGADRLPCVALSSELPGGHHRLATSVSSQFVTALLVPAPLARAPTTIELTGAHHSLPYIRQTLEMMRRFGVPVLVDEGEGEIAVPGGVSYRARDLAITGDYTSASYLIGAAFVSRGSIRVGNLDPASLQGERAVVDIVAALGARVEWLPERRTLGVDCRGLPSEVDASFDLRDCPNILPTVAALAATIPGRVRLTGAKLTEFHKSPRVSAMASELAKAGVPVRILQAPDGAVDGLEIRGQARLAGGVRFSGHHDHRIFMSLQMVALACERPCTFGDGTDTADSFPGFTSLGLAGEEAAPEVEVGRRLPMSA